MSCPIVETPPETKLAIIEALLADGTSQDLLNLSSTCHPFRQVLIPEIFKSIVLRNYEKSAAFVRAIVDGGYAHHVKELHYKGKYAIPECEYEEEAEEDDFDDETREKMLPASVEKILSDLSCFPKLEKLIVEFPFGSGEDNEEQGLNDDSEWVNAFYNFEWDEDMDDVKENEKKYGWRAMMAMSFDAIVKNNKSSIKSLELKGTVSKGVSIWNTQEWRDFLEPLEEFEISIRGNENGAGWHINTLEAYLKFLANLGTFFFNWLPNVTSISLHASQYGPIGLEGMRHAPFSLEPDSVPLLKSIDLEYVFIDPPLIDFLVHHCPTLESISFNKCMAGFEGLAENGIHWYNLFIFLIKASPKRLKHLEILPLKVDGVGDIGTNRYGDPELAKTAAQIMEEDEKRRAFPYRILDDKYGMLFEDEDTNLQAFLEGNDQREYDELMEIVKKNTGDRS